MIKVSHPDCVPKRSIFDNISLIRDIYYVAKLSNSDIGLILLDQEKAFMFLNMGNVKSYWF